MLDLIMEYIIEDNSGVEAVVVDIKILLSVPQTLSYLNALLAS